MITRALIVSKQLNEKLLDDDEQHIIGQLRQQVVKHIRKIGYIVVVIKSQVACDSVVEAYHSVVDA